MSEQELRELDAWIAEHVMGCKPKFKRYASHSDWECECPLFSHGKEHLDHGVSDYSTDPAAAMQVLEKCVADSEGYQIHIDDGYSVSWGKDGCSANGETLPLAIALFAKKLFTAA